MIIRLTQSSWAGAGTELGNIKMLGCLSGLTRHSLYKILSDLHDLTKFGILEKFNKYKNGFSFQLNYFMADV